MKTENQISQFTVFAPQRGEQPNTLMMDHREFGQALPAGSIPLAVVEGSKLKIVLLYGHISRDVIRYICWNISGQESRMDWDITCAWRAGGDKPESHWVRQEEGREEDEKEQSFMEKLFGQALERLGEKEEVKSGDFSVKVLRRERDEEGTATWLEFSMGDSSFEIIEEIYTEPDAWVCGETGEYYPSKKVEYSYSGDFKMYLWRWND